MPTAKKNVPSELLRVLLNRSVYEDSYLTILLVSLRGLFELWDFKCPIPRTSGLIIISERFPFDPD
jgi:hypothetical protein